MEKIPAEYYYAHFKHPKNLQDLPLTQLRIPNGLPSGIKFGVAEDIVFINTWIGAYSNADDLPFGLDFTPIHLGEDGICWKSYYKQFTYILSFVEKHFGKSYSLRPDIESYAHSIDFSTFDCSSVDKFIGNVDASKVVLISNGLVESNQTLLNNDMSKWIHSLSDEFPTNTFVCTRKFQTQKSNILFTDDIIKDISGHDMNEIAYLSTFVPKILGRNSGPFLFTNSGNNVRDPNKKMLALGQLYSQCFPAFLNFACDFKYVQDASESVVLDSMRKLVSEV
jgi:hypothetical protein